MKALILAFGLSLILAAPVWAHRVNVFAWEENGRIHTESSFSGGRLAQGAPIEVRDAATQAVLVTGTTDEAGAWDFAIPEQARNHRLDLLLVLQAGEGHRGEWLLRASDYLEETGSSRTLVDERQGPGPLRIGAGVALLLILGGALQLWRKKRNP